MTGTNLFQREDANYLEVKGWGSSELTTSDTADNSLYVVNVLRGRDSCYVRFASFSCDRSRRIL